MRTHRDIASIAEIQQSVRLGVISGVTTDPSPIARESPAFVRAYIQVTCSLIDGPVSMEALAQMANYSLTDVGPVRFQANSGTSMNVVE